MKVTGSEPHKLHFVMKFVSGKNIFQRPNILRTMSKFIFGIIPH